ncbi:MAG: hypothetical protein JO112_11595, partial [Planctomycetes bacterium]|nr:hypothetical protein [Planctomycetota bacterium]
MRKTLPALLLACGLVSLGGNVRAEEAAGPRKVLGRAIQAMGGEAKLKKLQVGHWKGQGTIQFFGNELSYTAEWFMQGPEHYRIDAQGDAFSYDMGIDGTKGWFKVEPIGSGTEDMDANRLREEKEEVYLQWLTTLVPLQDKAFQLSSVGEHKVEGRPALGIEVSHKGHRKIQLFFDKESGRLVKSTMPSERRGQKYTQDMFYRDYGEINGLLMARELITQ